MKNCKKLLALLLSVLMVFTMMATSAYAVETTEKTEIEKIEESTDEFFTAIDFFIDGLHNFVAFFMIAADKDCVFCGEPHSFTKDDSESTEPESEYEEIIDTELEVLSYVHNLIGEIMAVLGDTCPLCDETHVQVTE